MGRTIQRGFEGVSPVFCANEFTAHCSRAPRWLCTRKAVGLSPGDGFPVDAITRWQRFTHSSQINTLGPSDEVLHLSTRFATDEQNSSGLSFTFERDLLLRIRLRCDCPQCIRMRLRTASSAPICWFQYASSIGRLSFIHRMSFQKSTDDVTKPRTSCTRGEIATGCVRSANLVLFLIFYACKWRS
jgi:hypothetical protein